jgi:hypothetical protein
MVVDTATEKSAAKRVFFTSNVKYDGGFTVIFSRKQKKMQEAGPSIRNQSRSAPTIYKPQKCSASMDPLIQMTFENIMFSLWYIN